METEEKVVGFVEGFFKDKNLYVLLQLFWILEYYVLAIASVIEGIETLFRYEIKVPSFLSVYGERVSEIIDEYTDFLLLIPIAFIVAGLCGDCFKYVFKLKEYMNIYQYCDFGVYAGSWLLLIMVTYIAYSYLHGWFAVLYSLALFLLSGGIQKISDVMKAKGIQRRHRY